MKYKKYYERAAEILRYEPETGRLIRRISTSHRVKAGEEAGCTHSSGYRYVSTTVDDKKKDLRAHRIIWFIHYKELPEFLDHIDGNRLNNRIENLRPATRQQNNQNSRSAKNSSSKYLGVCWSKKSTKWLAQIYIDDKQKYLGLFDDETEAAEAYDAAAREYFGEFANPNFK